MGETLKIFVFDIDGVACDHAGAICAVINKEFGIASKKEDVTTWDHNFGPITFKEAVSKYYPISSFIEEMPVALGFSEFLKEISKTMKVFFASARRPCCHEATMVWIREKFGSKFKTHFVERKIELDFDYLIDDCPGEVLAAAELGRTSFLFSRPWNNNPETKKRLNDQSQAFFVENFGGVLKFLSKK